MHQYFTSIRYNFIKKIRIKDRKGTYNLITKFRLHFQKLNLVAPPPPPPSVMSAALLGPPPATMFPDTFHGFAEIVASMQSPDRPESDAVVDGFVQVFTDILVGKRQLGFEILGDLVLGGSAVLEFAYGC